MAPILHKQAVHTEYRIIHKVEQILETFIFVVYLMHGCLSWLIVAICDLFNLLHINHILHKVLAIGTWLLGVSVLVASVLQARLQ